MNYTNLSKPLLIGLVCIYLLYLVGWIWPEPLWGIHFFQFLKSEDALAILMVSLALALFPSDLIDRLYSQMESTTVKSRLALAVVVSLAYGMLVYSFPIAHDPYGDAVRFTDQLDKVVHVSPMVYHYLFGFSLDAWSGEKSVLALVTFISHHLNVTLGESFRLLGAFSAILFSLSWMCYLYLTLKEMGLMVSLYLVGLLGPYSLVFHGHAEIYAPAIAMIMVWVVILTLVIKNRTPINLALLGLVNIMVVKLHPIGVMLLPSTGIVLLTTILKHRLPAFRDKRLIPIVLIPAVTVGLLVYFFVLGDHVDDRSLQSTAMQYDHLFLPLISPAPPLHRYNLFSLYHFTDFFNVLLMSSPVLLLIFAFGLSDRIRERIDLSEALSHLILCLALFLLLLFAINPLLSMPMDWDLFMLFVPVMFGCSVAGLTPHLISGVRRLNALILSITVLSLSFVVSSQDVNNISDRLRSIAIHVHDSYYEWTMNITDRSFAISTEASDVNWQKRQVLRERLRKNAQVVDREFSEFLRQDAKYSYQDYNDYEAASSFLDQAFSYNPTDGNNHLTAVELNFQLKNMKQAFVHGNELVRMEFPDLETSLRIAIHCAIEAEEYIEAQNLCFRYLNNYENEFILKIYTRLVTKEDVESLKFLFQRSK